MKHMIEELNLLYNILETNMEEQRSGLQTTV